MYHFGNITCWTLHDAALSSFITFFSQQHRERSRNRYLRLVMCYMYFIWTKKCRQSNCSNPYVSILLASLKDKHEDQLPVPLFSWAFRFKKWWRKFPYCCHVSSYVQILPNWLKYYRPLKGTRESWVFIGHFAFLIMGTILWALSRAVSSYLQANVAEGAGRHLQHQQ